MSRKSSKFGGGLGRGEALQIQLQGTSFPLPTQLLQVLPHIVALAVLAGAVGAVGAARPPAALGRPWPE